MGSVSVRLSWWIVGLIVTLAVAIGTVLGHTVYYLIVLDRLP